MFKDMAPLKYEGLFIWKDTASNKLEKTLLDVKMVEAPSLDSSLLAAFTRFRVMGGDYTVSCYDPGFQSFLKLLARLNFQLFLKQMKLVAMLASL